MKFVYLLQSAQLVMRLAFADESKATSVGRPLHLSPRESPVSSLWVGEVFLPDGSNLNKQIVGAGYAWQYKRYSKDPAYADLEAGARVARLGLW